MDPYKNYYNVTSTYYDNSCTGKIGSIHSYYPEDNNEDNPKFIDITKNKNIIFHKYLCIFNCCSKKPYVEEGQFFHIHPSYEKLTKSTEYSDKPIDSYSFDDLEALKSRIENCAKCKVYFQKTTGYSNNGQQLIDDEHNKINDLVQNYISKYNN